MTLRDLFASRAIAARFRDEALVDGMLAFERALARAEGACGVIPADAAAGIDRIASSAQFDIDGLVAEARVAGTLAIPFVRHLTKHVSSQSEDAARYVHWGATSQDVVDTALVLSVRESSRLLIATLQRLGNGVATLAERHRTTPMVARTLLQPATPVPFGYKAAVWLDALARTRAAVVRATSDALVVQFGGASGVLAPLRDRGIDVAQRLARELDLALTAAPWHAIRDTIARLGAEVTIACQVVAKIAGDVVLLMQAEVGEAAEPAGAGRGGSSAMPHKRNPVGAMFAREAGLRSHGLLANLVAGVAGEHERGLGQWQTQFWTLGELFTAAGSAVEAMTEVVEGLVVDAGAMQRNLDAMHGFIYAEALTIALAPRLGKSAAHARVEALCRTALQSGTTLMQALDDDPALAAVLPADERAVVFSPASQFGAAPTMIDRALAAWRDEDS